MSEIRRRIAAEMGKLPTVDHNGRIRPAVRVESPRPDAPPSAAVEASATEQVAALKREADDARRQLADERAAAEAARLPRMRPNPAQGRAAGSPGPTAPTGATPQQRIRAIQAEADERRRLRGITY